MSRHLHVKHRRRWTIRYPFRWTCRCGMEAWPCPVAAILKRQEELGLADGHGDRLIWNQGMRYASRGQFGPQPRRSDES